MKKTFVLFTLLFCSAIFYAQNLPLYVNEDFTDNSAQWSVGNSEIDYSEVSAGHYLLKLKSSDYIYRYWNTIAPLTKMKQYVIEVKLRQTSGEPTSYFGIIWDSDGATDCNEFLISSDGFYTIMKKDTNKQYTDFTGDVFTEVINGLGKYNVLKIYKHNSVYDFYINGHWIQRLDVGRLGIAGDDVGFELRDVMGVDVDYIKIYGQPLQMNVVENPLKTKKINLGTGVNTVQSELAPYIAPGGDYLYFVRTVADDYKLYVSKKQNGRWTKALQLPPPFNDQNNNALFYVSADRNTYIVSGTYDNGKFVKYSGLSIIRRKADGTWSEPERIIISDYRNEWDYYSFTFSQDRKVLIMSIIDPRNCIGNSDLYVSFLQDDGTYSKPENLGEDVNTPFTEGTPFLAPDGVTLYFSSDGYPGYGDRDIYVTRRLDNTWRHWSKPQNLGPSVNTDGWDAYFSIDAEGKNAYLVSTANSYGNEDIFMLPLSETARPRPVVIFSGKVVDSLTDKPLYAKIYYFDSTKSAYQQVAITNPSTGDFSFVLPQGQSYQLLAVSKDYFSGRKTVKPIFADSSLHYRLNFNLLPLKVGQSIVFHNILFPAGRTDFLPQSYADLNKLVLFLKQNPDVRILVAGHTNNIGKHSSLMDLSLRRAKAVKQYLVQHGISPDRIETVGYGPDRPVASNATAEGRRKNQRVEVKILSVK